MQTMDESENDDAAAVREQLSDGGRDDHSSSEPQAAAAAIATRDSRPSNESKDASQIRNTTASPPSAAFARRNPFDPRVSHRDPFPRFEDSMAGFRPDADDDADENDTSGLLDTLYKNSSSSTATGAVNLDWSIDTIAELKPMAFSPLSEQKNPSDEDHTSDSTANTSSLDRFFEDEAQFNVLRTPSPLIRQQEQQQQTQSQYLAQVQTRQRPPHPHSSASPATPGPPPRAPTPPSIPSHNLRSSTQRRLSLSESSASADLHRRCQDAIAFCEDRLRERDRKLSRLQLPSPDVKAQQKKNKNKRIRERDSEFPWKTHSHHQQRGSEPKGIHPRSTPSSKPGISPSGASPFSVPITPILSSAHGMRTPTTKKSGGEQERVDPEFSFDGGSPISPIAPFPGHREGDEEETKDNGPGTEAGAKSFAADSLSSSYSDGEERDKENRASAAQKPTARARAKPASSESPSFTLSTSSSWGKAAEDSFSLRTLARLQDQSDNSLSSISASTPGPDSSAEPSWLQTGTKNHDSTQQQQQHQLPASPSIAQRQESFMAAIEAEARPRPSASASTEEAQATNQ